MSTRAVFSFVDSLTFSAGNDRSFHVYKHHDGYPSGAAEAIGRAIGRAWNLPRFEAAEFATAFIAGNKLGAGGVYMTEGPEYHGDLDFRYEVRCRKGVLEISAFSAGDAADTWQLLYVGSYPGFSAWVAGLEAAIA